LTKEAIIAKDSAMGPSSWSFRLTRLAGIEVKLHVSFALVFVLGAWQWGQNYGVRGALFGVLLMALLFICVTLHELAHSLVARSFQLPADEIVLYPFGGAAQVEQDAPKPMQELLVAIAGPAINIMIAAVLLVVTSAKLELAKLSPHWDGTGLTRASLAQPTTNTMLVWLISANVMMAVFNMIPALPLDGGRVLRAILCMRLRARTATLIASGLGQVLSIGAGVAGVVMHNYGLALTALVIFFGAVGEQNVQGRRSALASLHVGEVFNRNAITLTKTDKVTKVIDHILTSYQPDFAVMEGGRLIGVVTRKRVLEALANNQGSADVSAIMDTAVPRVDAAEALDELHDRMTRDRISIVAVYGGSNYLGLVSQDDLAEAKLVAGYVQRREEADIEGTP
jgi:Zn-dependent protease/predicted transcriptional regulator